MFQTYAVFLWFGLMLAHRPISPDNMVLNVVISNLAHRDLVMTMYKEYVQSPKDNIIALRKISYEYIAKQVFNPFKSVYRGLILKHGDARLVMDQDYLVAQTPVGMNDEYENIFIKEDELEDEEGHNYPHLFRIISGEKCLSLVPDYDAIEEIYIPKFKECKTRDKTQIWKMFTEARAMAFLEKIENFDDSEDETLSILIDQVEAYSRDILGELRK
ncbi:hypothetical protein PAEPH01_2142 [Pancytospora epiphaga]|nr:hypothetical protein PAEPH01_2142 [Pancytospora epiphaga]